MKRTSKRYVISTSALNCYSYRVLTNGIDYSQYLNNPILLWMHNRANSNDRNQILPLGRVIDLRVEGDALTCYLEFDETDTFAMSIFNKYENGTLNMLSLGAKPLEWSDAPEMMLQGQTQPTFTKVKMLDVSCVDIGGNDEAFACQLYDKNDCKIELSLGNKTFLLQLNKANKPLSTEIKHKPTIMAIVKNAVDAGKFDSDQANTLLSTGNDDPSVKNILAIVKSTKINPENLDGKIPPALIPLTKKDYDDIGSGDMGVLKSHAPEVYKAKFFEKNGRLPAEKDGKPL